MNDSILDSVKEALGIIPEYTHFDSALVMHINTVFSILNQLKVGPDEGFEINDNSKTWSDFIQNEKKLNMVKTFMFQKVKLIFDPPQHSALVEAINKQLNEIEFRLNLETDRGNNYAWKGNDNELSESGLLE